MPYIGLVITSTSFIIPCVVSMLRRKKTQAILSGVLTATSVMNHGTHNKTINRLDVLYAHGLSTHFVLDCFINRRSLMEKACICSVPYFYYSILIPAS